MGGFFQAHLMSLPGPITCVLPLWRGVRPVVLSFTVSVLALAGCAHHDYAHYQAKALAPEKSAAELEARSLEDPGLRKFLTENLQKDFSGGRSVEWDFETLCWVAFYFNPTLDVARAQWESAQAAQKTAVARPNPTLTLTPGFSSNPGGASPWLPAIGLDFAFEPAVQRDRRAEVARLNAEAARQAVFAAAWQVRGELRRACNDFTLAGDRAKQVRAQEEACRQILALVEQRRAAGAATATDVAAARLALTKAEIASVEAAGQIAPARQRLAQTLGVPTTTLDIRLYESPGRGGITPERLALLRSQALRTRSDVLSALARYAVAESAVALEVERQHPGLHLGPGYQWDQGQSKWTLALTLELPLFNHNEGPLAEAEAHRHETAAQFAAVQAQVLAEIDSAEATQTATAAQSSSLERVQAELQAQLANVEIRIRAGVADQLELQNARLELAAATQALVEAGGLAIQAAGQLEDALQIPIANLDALAPAVRAPATTAKSP